LDRAGDVLVRGLVVVAPGSVIRVAVDAVEPDSGEDEERGGTGCYETDGVAA
jgi:hypothetical protein